MLIGVVSFSFATGALSSLLTSSDSEIASVKEKIATLNDIQNQYLFDIELFNKLAKTIRYDHSRKKRGI